MHKPSHVREDFLSYLDSLEPCGTPAAEADHDRLPIYSLLVTLRDCSDILPADYCDQLDLPKGSSYEAAVGEVETRLTPSAPALQA